jgi:hypothetical protein
LHRSPCSVPERACDAVGICHSAALEKSGSPSPCRNNTRSNETWLDISACGVELFARLR